MKAAMIPPVPDLDRYATGPGIHLLLSHLFKKKGYLDYYARRSDEGDYLILDNSAHEHGIGNSMEQLLKEARKVCATEVVVPDVLFDAKSTVESARLSLRYLEERKGERAWDRAGKPRLMYVPQGNNRPEWSWCLRTMLNLHDHAHLENNELPPPVIGVSKDYYWWHGGLPALFKAHLNPLKAARPSIDVHLLGWPTALWQTALIAREFPWVRSTDSAKPFVYAKNGILLEPGGKVPEYPRRDPRYFDDPLLHHAEIEMNGTMYTIDEIARRNMTVFESAATDHLILAA